MTLQWSVVCALEWVTHFPLYVNIIWSTSEVFVSHWNTFITCYRSSTEPIENKHTEACLAPRLSSTLWDEIKWHLLDSDTQADQITGMCQRGWKAILRSLQMFCFCCCGMFSVIWMFVCSCCNNEVKPFQNNDWSHECVLSW